MHPQLEWMRMLRTFCNTAAHSRLKIIGTSCCRDNNLSLSLYTFKDNINGILYDVIGGKKENYW